MKNENAHIGIVGAGIIGSTIYQLLVSCGKNYQVTIADQKENNDPPVSYTHLTLPTKRIV